VLKYFKNFHVPQWVEVPQIAIEYQCLPLVIQQNSSTTKVYEFPAHWYYGVIGNNFTFMSKLYVFVKSKLEIDLLNITIQQWFACHKNPAFPEHAEFNSSNYAEDCGPNCNGQACRPFPPYAGQDIVKLLATFHRLYSQSWDRDPYMRETGVDIRLVYSGTSNRPRVYVKCPFYMDMKPTERKHYRPVNTGELQLCF